jgi:hypothetical protein
MDVKEIVGMTMKKVFQKTYTVTYGDRDAVVFESVDGRRFILHHRQDCCETVRIEDICGDLEDLEDAPILVAEEAHSYPPKEYYEEQGYHLTWTFYHFRTMDGTVTIRWHGRSNGYYSEKADFDEIDANGDIIEEGGEE